MALALALSACAEKPASAPSVTASYSVATYEILPGWSQGDPRPALAAFGDLCAHYAFAGHRPSEVFPTLADVKSICGQLPPAMASADEARAFIEAHFIPYAVLDEDDKAEGLFTGYDEPEVETSLTRHGRYQTPIYGRPRDLVTVDLGLFSEKLQGQRIIGQVRDGALLPYPDRAAIDAGGIAAAAPVLAWAADPVAVFFLEIQGSGILALDDGSRRLVGYAIGNGRLYTAIGKTLIASGDLPVDSVTAEAIMVWLRGHPDRAQAVMETNQSFVFFKNNTGKGAIGAAGHALTPGISLAVDRRAIPLGTLVWLDAPPVTNLMLAEDAGGAINGAVRGDVFFGPGPQAAAAASSMKSTGRYWVLVPRQP